MQITSLLVIIATHLDVVVLSNDDIVEHLLNNALLYLGLLLSLLLLGLQLVDIMIVVFVTILILLSLICLCLHLCWIFAFSKPLGRLLKLLAIALNTVRCHTLRFHAHAIAEGHIVGGASALPLRTSITALSSDQPANSCLAALAHEPNPRPSSIKSTCTADTT